MDRWLKLTKAITPLLILATVVVGFALWRPKSPEPAPRNDKQVEELAGKVKTLEATIKRQEEERDIANRHADAVRDYQNKMIQKMVDENAGDVSKTRLALMAILLNENFAALQAGKPEDFIFIERDWKITRMPKHLDVNQSDMKWILQFLDKEKSLVPQPPGAPGTPER